MSLQEMAWLTQGPMAAVDLELDVESMEQEAVEEEWVPPEAPGGLPSNQEEVHGEPPVGESLDATSSDTLSATSKNSLGGIPDDPFSIPIGKVVAKSNRGQDAMRKRRRSIAGGILSVAPGDPFIIDPGEDQREDGHGEGGEKALQPKPRRGRRRTSEGETTTPATAVNSPLQPKFGAIKVHAGILGASEETKSFVVTNETTSRDLVAIVLASYHVVCENHNLFGLVLEKSNKRFGFSGSQRAIKLQDTSKPLELQTRYNRADTRFCLQLRPGAGVLTLHDSLIQPKTQDDKPNKVVSRSVFVSEKTTCRDVIGLSLRIHNLEEKADDFSLFELDSNSKNSHELCLDHRPLVLQQQWLDPHEYYFEIRPKVAPQERKMRRHSIGSVDGLRRQSQAAGKVLNIKAVRKSLIPRIKRGGSSGNISKTSESYKPKPVGSLTENGDHNGVEVAPPSSDRETTMAKLKDSLSKLREHLDSLQKRKTMSGDPESDSEALHMPHGDGPRHHSDSSDESYQPRANPHKTQVASYTTHAPTGGYDTGDTSLNESDAGSTSTSQRGNNDSAYASDRMSHTSMTSQNMSYSKATSQGNLATGHTSGASLQRRRARRGSYTSSDQSSPEYQDGPTRGSTQLRKTQSLYELQRAQLEIASQAASTKQTRVRSASHAQPKVGRPVRKNGAISGSDEQLNTWARRKQYDVRRRIQVDDPAQTEPVKRSQSFQDIKPEVVMRGGRPTSAGFDRSASQMSGSSSSIRGGVKMRRTLPKVPVGTEADIEERRKRMSAEIIRRARAGVNGDSGQLTLLRSQVVNGYANSDHSDFRSSQASLDDNNRVPVIRCSPDTTSSSREDFGQRRSVHSSQPYNGQVHAPQPKYSSTSNLQDPRSYLSNKSTDSTPQKLTNGHDSEASDMDDLYNDLHQGDVKSKQTLPGESSQEALQRIINDLRNAATKPYEGSVSSRAGSRSSVSSITREYAPETAEEQAEVVYSQLAQWGVLEPSEDDLSSQKYYNHQYSAQQTSNDEDDREEEGEEEEEEVEVEETEDEQTEDQLELERHYQSSQAYSKSSCHTNESISSVSDHSDLRVEHPTIHRVLRSCDLVRATMERCDIFADFGFEIFESTFYDIEGKERSKRAVFRTPSGRRPVLGRRKGAFMPVAPVNQGNQEAGPILSLVAVDNVVDGSPADKCGVLQEGDYIIEVNGLYVVDADVERVRAEFAEAGNCLDLVLARPHEMGVDRIQNEDGEGSAEVRKDLERLKLKYDAMKQDAERSQDTIADLKLELKDRDRQMGQLESDLRMRDDQFTDMEKSMRQKDEEVSEWKYEANHRNVELARLKYETKQKDDRISQLRRLLIQQTELMQMHQVRNSAGTDLEDFEEHVSAV